jgi:zinc protease
MAQAKTRTLEMPRDESLVMIGFLTVGVKDRDRYALDVLGSILSGDSGRLFSELREEQSLAYTLGCAQRLGLDSGCMVLYAATTQDKVNQTKNEIIREIKKTRSSLVGDEELESAKHELMTGHDIAMQANGFFSIESALNEIYGLGYEAVYGYKDAIASVTKEDVKTVAAKYLDPERRAEVIISPK